MESLRFCRDGRGDMAEKAVVMAAIIIGAYAVWQLLGNRLFSPFFWLPHNHGRSSVCNTRN